MSTEKPAGWYYVGAGQLRYRDEGGWTEHFMATTDPRAGAWPPPAPEKPKSYVEWVEEDLAARRTEALKSPRGSLGRLFRRGERRI